MRTYTADEVDALIGRALARERERVAQQQEPPTVAELVCVCGAEWEWRNRDWELVATPPAQRTWVGLTRAERFEIEKAMSKYYDYQHECKTVCLPEFARAIEAKLREKNQ